MCGKVRAVPKQRHTGGFSVVIFMRLSRSENIYLPTFALKRGFPVRGMGEGLPIRTFPAFYTTSGERRQEGGEPAYEQEMCCPDYGAVCKEH